MRHNEPYRKAQETDDKVRQDVCLLDSWTRSVFFLVSFHLSNHFFRHFFRHHWDQDHSLIYNVYPLLLASSSGWSFMIIKSDSPCRKKGARAICRFFLMAMTKCQLNIRWSHFGHVFLDQAVEHSCTGEHTILYKKVWTRLCHAMWWPTNKYGKNQKKLDRT